MPWNQADAHLLGREVSKEIKNVIWGIPVSSVDLIGTRQNETKLHLAS
jgi:hypothetical protein